MSFFRNDVTDAHKKYIYINITLLLNLIKSLHLRPEEVWKLKS